ncbi:MAG TPA: hypothetical protein VFV78_00715 [Vicinamibacterales bacterium]|nr:hypothetical protein [Vicinamibacterales bacterium]
MAYTPQTAKTTASVSRFLAKATAGPRLADAKRLVGMLQKATGDKAAMWGPAIVGCGTRTIAYADGRKAQWPTVAFSPRKSAFVFYIAWRKHPDLLKKIGKYKTVGGCLHVKTLQDIDEPALQRLITAAHRTWAD